MTEEQKKAIDACKDQAAKEFATIEGEHFDSFLAARGYVSLHVLIKIYDRAMQLYGEQCAEAAVTNFKIRYKIPY